MKRWLSCIIVHHLDLSDRPLRAYRHMVFVSGYVRPDADLIHAGFQLAGGHMAVHQTVVRKVQNDLVFSLRHTRRRNRVAQPDDKLPRDSIPNQVRLRVEIDHEYADHSLG